ncbi:MAG TPA: PIN domain-containing protein [Pirellulales bacterium]|nr:PIN domain-containing protein [Pirellulales bacterium]
MDKAILDTDILSEVLKAKDQDVLTRAKDYLAVHQRLAFSSITYYEILRGLIAKRAGQQLAKFLKTARTSDLLPVNLPVLRRAAELWAEAQMQGHPRDDADLIIAATALDASRELVTGNLAHFTWIRGLRVTDWRTPKP